ncbi:MAG: transposase [Pyrinomonadaceae bacterium]
MWNDTDTPLAILITFRTHGTWLHGDKRGSVDRHDNKFGAPRIQEQEHFEEISRARLKHSPVKLSAARRRSIEKAIRETCRLRGWRIYAFNIRTNHVHIVVDAGGKDPNQVMTALKANATRQM